jgi:hypothetical protein
MAENNRPEETEAKHVLDLGEYNAKDDNNENDSFTITHFPQNSIIPTAPRMGFNFHTSSATLKQSIF